MTYLGMLCFLYKFFVFFYKSAPRLHEVLAVAFGLLPRASGPFAPWCASHFFKASMNWIVEINDWKLVGVKVGLFIPSIADIGEI